MINLSRHNNTEPVSTLLLIEDEKEIRHFVRKALGNELYKVIEADSVKQGLIRAETDHPDAVILDLGLPDGSGVEFIQGFRQWSQVPILVLSARNAEQDKIAALDSGADDYISKPFSVGELLARIRALLRRSHSLPHDKIPVFTFSDITVDLACRTVIRNEKIVHLTPIEYRLLTLLITNAGKVLTHRYLLREIWGPDCIESSHYLRIYVSHLRQKLELDATQPKHFLTETGIGYRFHY